MALLDLRFGTCLCVVSFDASLTFVIPFLTNLLFWLVRFWAHVAPILHNASCFPLGMAARCACPESQLLVRANWFGAQFNPFFMMLFCSFPVPPMMFQLRSSWFSCTASHPLLPVDFPMVPAGSGFGWFPPPALSALQQDSGEFLRFHCAALRAFVQRSTFVIPPIPFFGCAFFAHQSCFGSRFHGLCCGCCWGSPFVFGCLFVSLSFPVILWPLKMLQYFPACGIHSWLNKF